LLRKVFDTLSAAGMGLTCQKGQNPPFLAVFQKQTTGAMITVMPKQSDHIRKLYREYLEAAKDVIPAQYAEAEKRGEVKRDKDAYALAPEVYAKKLWSNGWRSGGGKKPYLREVLQQHTAKRGVRLASN
jgi:hypothetical protein